MPTKPTKLNTAASAIAAFGVRQRVETTVAMAFGASVAPETAVTPMKRRQKKTAADTPIQKILRVAVFRRECKQYLREYGFTPVMGCAQIDHTPYGLVRSPRAPAVGVACLAPVKRGNNLSPPSAALPTPLYPLHLPVTRKKHPAFVHLQRLFLLPSILR